MAQEKPKFSGLVAISSGSPLAWTQLNALSDVIGPFPVLLVSQSEPATVPSAGLFSTLGRGPAKLAHGLRKPFSKGRIEKIIEENELRIKPDLDQYTTQIRRADTLRCQDVLKSIGPKAVFVMDAGTLSRDTISAVDAPFLRFHGATDPHAPDGYVGFSPLNGERAKTFGACLHTLEFDGKPGEVVADIALEPEESDTIHTYPWRIAALARPMTVNGVRGVMADNDGGNPTDEAHNENDAPGEGEEGADLPADAARG